MCFFQVTKIILMSESTSYAYREALMKNSFSVMLLLLNSEIRIVPHQKYGMISKKIVFFGSQTDIFN
jgi:hypothetical protein